MKKVSVVIPVYNAEKFIGQCIESVLSQSYENFEVLVVNDGSTDKSEEKILPYLEKDKRIKYFSQDNKGVGAARNLALRRSTGDYIAFLDADDIYFPWALREMVNLMNEDNNIVALSGWIWSYNEKLIPLIPDNIPSPGVVNYQLVPFNKLSVSTSIINLRLFKYNISFSETIKLAEDYNFWLKLSKLGKAKVCPIYLAKYRIHDMQASRFGTIVYRGQVISDVWQIDGNLIVDVFINNKYTLDSLMEASEFLVKNVISYFNKQKFLTWRDKLEGNIFWAREIFYRLRKYLSPSKSLLILSKLGLAKYFLVSKFLQSKS